MLPKIDVPMYDLELPLSKLKIKFRPFLVKEEKLLLMAVESDDKSSMILAIKHIINNCCIGDVDVESLPIVDIEYIFLNLRARSVGEIVELQYQCNNDVQKINESGEVVEGKCGHINKVNVNILDIKPIIDKDITNIIPLHGNIGVALKYPNFKDFSLNNDSKDEISLSIDMILNSIDYIYDADNMYYAKDTSKEELQEFIETLSRKQYKKIHDFFDSIPKIKTTIDFKCSKCGYSKKIEVEGIQNFLS